MEFDSSLGDGNNYLDMDGQEIQNLKYPTDSSDAANKKYVDDELFSGSFISSSMTSSMSVATASYVENAQTASYITTAQTASYIEASNIDGTITSASYALSASYAVSASFEIIKEVSSSYADTASYVENAQTASFVTTAQTASYVEIAQTASMLQRLKQHLMF